VTTATEKLMKNMSLYHKSPVSVKQNVLDVLEDGLNGYDIVDPNNAFIFAMTASCTLSSSCIVESESRTRSLYPQLAKDPGDIYRHMSDSEYIGRFSTPSVSELSILLPYEALLRESVLNPNTSIRSAVIPRNTRFTVDDTVMGIHYPIRIDILPQGNIQTTYDTSQISPAKALTSNVVTTNRINIEGVNYLQLMVPVEQFDIESVTHPLDITGTFRQSIGFTDNFYFCRAFVDRGNGTWEEIKTTHSLQVYDPNEVTLVLEVGDGILDVRLPEIYHSTNIAGDVIRIDIYTTKGDVTEVLRNLSPSSFSANWLDLDTLNPEPLAAPLSNISDWLIFANKDLAGGTRERTFEEMRARSINRTERHDVPITETDIKSKLELNGYSVQKYIDNVTDRLFVASKLLPSANRRGLDTKVKASVENVYLTNEIEDYSETIVDNGDRFTIKPNALFRFQDGQMKPLLNGEIQAIEGLSDAESLVATINSNDYWYTPFYYVLDVKNDIFNVRPYILDNPSITARSFEMINSKVNYAFNTSNISVSLIDDKYTIVVDTIAPQGVPQSEVIHCQLKYTSPFNDDIVFQDVIGTATSPTGVRFTFEFETNFDINLDNRLMLTNLKSVNDVTLPLVVDLISKFDLFYLVEGDNTGLETTIDDQPFDTGTAVVLASYETVTFEFADFQDNLYAPGRSIVGLPTYKKHTVDVPAVYEERVYQEGPYGYAFVEEANGSITLEVKHEVGDPVLDSSGNPVLKHSIGDDMKDSSGNKIIETEAMIEYLAGVCLFDASYRFVTAETGVASRDKFSTDIRQYLENEIQPIAKDLSDRTELSFKPKGTARNIKVHIGGGIETTIPNELTFNIRYYLREAGIKDPSYISNLELDTRTILGELIGGKELALSNIKDRLKEAGGPLVADVDIDRFGADKSISIMTLSDEGTSFNIREYLTVLADGRIDLTDSVEISFNRSM